MEIINECIYNDVSAYFFVFIIVSLHFGAVNIYLSSILNIIMIYENSI